jgi:nucleoside-diphosphate-sugar epimerase
MRQRIAITGGLGYIGQSLSEELSSEFEVDVLDVKPSGASKFGNYLPCDITDQKQTKKALDNVDLVIHTAIIQIPQITQAKRLSYQVNVLGTQNICNIVENNPKIKGMLLSGSWHTIGEKDLHGKIDEDFGFRPDKVEDRARLYALSKMAQEAICRYYDEMSSKIYGIIRMGTVLGDGMPRETAANIFIEKGLRGESLTPYKHSMYRPMLYVDVRDICKAYSIFAKKILSGELQKSDNSSEHIINVYNPTPMTIIELAETVRECIIDLSNGKIKPIVNIVDKGVPSMFTEKDKEKISVDISKAQKFLGIEGLCSPKDSLKYIIQNRMK